VNENVVRNRRLLSISFLVSVGGLILLTGGAFAATPGTTLGAATSLTLYPTNASLGSSTSSSGTITPESGTSLGSITCSAQTPNLHPSTTAKRKGIIAVGAHALISCPSPIPNMTQQVTLYYDLGLGFTQEIAGTNLLSKNNTNYLNIGTYGPYQTAVGTAGEYTSLGYHQITEPNGQIYSDYTSNSTWLTRPS